MPTPLTLLKNLSYPLIATTSAGSGALVMYFVKPETDLEEKKKKWDGDIQKLKSEIGKLNSEAQSIESLWDQRVGREQKSVNQLVNFRLTMYEVQVTRYVNCLDKLFDEISDANWTGLHYDDKARVSRCRTRPVIEKLQEE